MSIQGLTTVARLAILLLCVVHLLLHDARAQVRATTRISVDSLGNQANGPSSTSSISADGRFVAFISSADNLVPGDTNGTEDVFVHDRQTGETTRVSIDSMGRYCQVICVKFSSLSSGKFLRTFPTGLERQLNSIFNEMKANKV